MTRSSESVKETDKLTFVNEQRDLLLHTHKHGFLLLFLLSYTSSPSTHPDKLLAHGLPELRVRGDLACNAVARGGENLYQVSSQGQKTKG